MRDASTTPITPGRDAGDTEQALRDRLGEVSREADRLTHEFNNLLTTILGHASLLARSLDSRDPRHADLDEIVHGAQRVTELVRQVRALGSDPDQGFDADQLHPIGQHPEASPAALATVVVVDDERPVRYLVRTILTRAGYEVVEAATADDAEAWLATHTGPLDLLISDVALPGGGGPELLQRMRARRPEIKYLFMSGYSDEAIRRDPRIEPGAAFVQKPFTAETLSLLVKELLSS